MIREFRILFLDFETYDPNLRTYGMGWCFKYHYPEVEFEVLGCGLLDCEGKEHYLDFQEDNEFINLQYQCLKGLIKRHDVIVCHNAMYDIGIIKYLFRDEDVLKDKVIVDTMLLAKHDNQHRFSYGLDSLCKDYKCVEGKESDLLHEYAWLSGLYQADVKERTGRSCHTPPTHKTMNNWCMGDMRRFPSGIVRDYCLQDIRATKALYDVLEPLTQYIDKQVDSDIIKVCIDCKLNGVRINTNKAIELLDDNKRIAEEEEDIVHVMLGWHDDFNINSSKILGRLLVAAGYKIPVTDKGNISLQGKWLDEQPEEIFQHIRRYRKALKVNEYIQKLVSYQDVIPVQYRKEGIGWLYPTLKPYGATATGRFSSGGGEKCNELNIQQIPRRDEDFGAPMRALFLPHEGERLICLDFSSQEPRLMVHYATLLGCTGAKEIAQKYREDPSLSYHNLVAEMCNIVKDHAKTINLGLAYGMGDTKLINSLGVDYVEGKRILRQYHKLLPFLKQLQHITEKNMVKLGYIKTIGGRKLKLGPMEYPNKTLNKLMQGSAADQIIKSMIAANKAGVRLLFCVHDEIIASSSNAEEDYKILEDCMLNSVKVVVPMYSDGGIGSTWREAK